MLFYFRPGFISPKDVFRTHSRAALHLGDTAAVLPQSPVYLLDRFLYLFRLRKTQKTLPVKFPPKGNFTGKRRQVFHSNTENLSIDGVQSQFNQIRQDLDGIARRSASSLSSQPHGQYECNHDKGV